MKILLTNANSYKAVVIAKFIKEKYNNIKVLGMTKNSLGRIFCSKYFDEVFINHKIEGLINKNNINLIIPIDSKTIGDWLKLRPKLQHTLDYYSDYSVFEKLNNKSSFAVICNKLNIPIPRSFSSKDIRLLENNKTYVFKPTSSSSSKGVRYFKNLDVLKEHCKNYEGDFVIQEYFKGDGGGISFFAINGKIHNYYLHKRITEYPVSGGSSTMRGPFDSVLKDEIVRAAESLISHVGWSGFCMLEFKYSKKEFVFIEANPRIWGSVYQGLANGNNYFEQLLGLPDNPLTTVRTQITYQSPLVFVSLLGYFLKGDLKSFANFSNIFKAEPDINLFSDPKGYIGQFLV
jgi:predicted ATP-grasp superfamily ATP-dependent carboligase